MATKYDWNANRSQEDPTFLTAGRCGGVPGFLHAPPVFYRLPPLAGAGDGVTALDRPLV